MKNPYEILGVSETDDKDTVRRVFKDKFREYQELQKDGRYTEDTHREFLELDEAYEVIMGIKHRDDASNNVAHGRLAVIWYHIYKWFDNYWYYYKLRAIIVLFIVLYIISYLTIPEFRLKKTILVSIPNSISYTYRETLEKKMTEFSRDVFSRYDKVFISYSNQGATGKSYSSTSSASSWIPKGIITSFAGGSTDIIIIIVGREAFNKLTSSGKLLNLDKMAGRALDDGIKQYGKAEKDTEEHVYGVSLKDTWIFDEISKGILDMKPDYELIATISVKADRPRDSFKLLRAMVEK